MKKKKVYFDNAATTPLDPRVKETMVEVMENVCGNPSSIHGFGREARVVIEKSRRTVAAALNASPAEIVFTSGATEALNTALHHACSKGVKKVITSRLEHPAVLETLDYLKIHNGLEVAFVEINAKGELAIDSLEALLQSDDAAKLVCLMHANNEIGNLLPLKEVSKLCCKYKALFLCDTVQTVGKYPIDLKHIWVDFIVGSAHKFYGPKAAGFLYVNGANRLQSFIHGGGQERDQRAGTENIYGIAGMAEAIKIAEQEMEENRHTISDLKAYAVDRLKCLSKEVVFNGTSEENGLYTIVNVTFPGLKDPDMLLFNLDIEGVAVSGGSACSSGVNTPSHVLAALNVDPLMASIRISFSKWNTKAEIDYLISVLEQHL